MSSRLFSGSGELMTAHGAQVYAASAGFAISLWVNGAGQGTNVVYAEEHSTISPTPFFLLQVSGTTNTRINALGKNDAHALMFNMGSGAASLDGAWHHFAFTQDGANAWTYVDGGNAVTVAYTAATTTTDQVWIGGDTSAQDLSGCIAHMATWKRRLSAQEIAQLAQGADPRGLQAWHYWPLQEGGIGIDLGRAVCVPAKPTGTKTSGKTPPRCTFETRRTPLTVHRRD